MIKGIFTGSQSLDYLYMQFRSTFKIATPVNNILIEGRDGYLKNSLCQVFVLLWQIQWNKKSNFISPQVDF